MGQSSDQLRQEIDQHRHDAERKIDSLQHQVQGTAEDLKSEAQGTVNEMGEQVQGAVESAAHTLGENVDIEKFVQERPLVSLGAALIGGFVLGGLLGDGDGGSSGRHHDGYTGERGGHSGQSGGSNLGGALRKAIRESGIEDTFSNAAAAMVGSASEQFKRSMDKNMPGFASKMEEAKHTDGSVMDKTREVQP